MVIEWLLDFFEAGFNFIVGLFPTNVPNPVELFGGALGYLGDLNYFLPITELAAAVIGVIIIAPLFLGVTLSTWLIALIRGGSSRG